MNQKKNHKSAPLLAAVMIILAFFLMIAVFLLSGKDQSAPITLPDNAATQTQQPDTPQPTLDNFVQVTPENVQQVVETLSRPTSYHQIYTVTVAEGERKSVQIVDMWVNGTMLRADTTSDTGVSSVLTNREKIYLWYADENEPVEITLNDTISPDDLLGLPTYELLLDADSASITHANYLTLQESVLQCVYVSVNGADGLLKEYWIDIDTGLLYKANFTLNDQVIYSAVQEELNILAAEDEAFLDQFLLPDGTEPFSAE